MKSQININNNIITGTYTTRKKSFQPTGLLKGTEQKQIDSQTSSSPANHFHIVTLTSLTNLSLFKTINTDNYDNHFLIIKLTNVSFYTITDIFVSTTKLVFSRVKKQSMLLSIRLPLLTFNNHCYHLFIPKAKAIKCLRQLSTISH